MRVGDGAMGTELLKRGAATASCLPELNLSRPERVGAVHRDYAAAGSELHRTNTFTANRLRLAPFGLGGKVREINAAGVRIAREAAGRGADVWGSVGPLTGTPASEDDRRRAYSEQLAALVEAGCDQLVLETFPEAGELAMAVGLAAGYGVTVNAELVVGEDLRCRDGEEVSVAAGRAVRAGAGAVGVNCTSPAVAARALRAMTGFDEVHLLIAFPSAGLPGRVEPPEAFAAAAAALDDGRVSVVGGCCGAGPEHIRALAAILRRPRPSG